MPVTRAKIRVQNTASGSVTRAAPSDYATNLRQNASAMARQAGEYASALTETNVEEARLLAREAALNPQGLNPNVANRMGQLAQRTFDRTLEQRLDQRLAVEMQRISASARAAHPYDVDAANAQIQSEMDAYLQHVPDSHRAVAAEMGTAEQASTVAGIAYNTAQLDIQNRSSEMVTRVDTYVNRIGEDFARFDDTTAEARAEEAIADIRSQPPEIMTAGEQARAVDRVRYQVGLSRMIRDYELQDLSMEELVSLAEGLNSGNHSAVGLFVNTDGEGVNLDAARQAAGYVQQYMQGANMDASNALARANEHRRQQLVTAGQAPDTAEYQESLDNVIGSQLGLQGPTGGARPLQVEDWADVGSWPSEKRNNVMAMIHTAGIVPPSLRQFMRGMENIEDPQQLMAAFDSLRHLDQGAGLQGNTNSLVEALPERVREIYTRADIMTADDGFPDRATMEASIRHVIAHQDEPWDDVRRAERWGTEAATVQTEMDEAVRTEIFGELGTPPYPEAERAAKQLVDEALLAGADREGAIEYALDSMQNRWVATEYMSSAFSDVAPEKHFPDPAYNGFWDAVTRIGADVAGGAVRLGEDELSSGLIAATFGIDVHLPGHRLGAPLFDQLANQHIQANIQSLIGSTSHDAYEAAGGADIDLKLEQWLEPGQDYRLVQDDAGGGLPVYHVQMRGPHGHWETLPDRNGDPFRLDVRPDYTRMEEISSILSAVQEETGTDLAKWLEEPASQGALMENMPNLLAILNSDSPYKELALVQEIRRIQGSNEPVSVPQTLRQADPSFIESQIESAGAVPNVAGAM